MSLVTVLRRSPPSAPASITPGTRTPLYTFLLPAGAVAFASWGVPLSQQYQTSVSGRSPRRGGDPGCPIARSIAVISAKRSPVSRVADVPPAGGLVRVARGGSRSSRAAV